MGRLEGRASVFDAALNVMEGPVEFVRNNINELEVALEFKKWQSSQAKVDEVQDKIIYNLQLKVNSQDEKIKKLEQRLERAFGMVLNLLDRSPAGKYLTN